MRILVVGAGTVGGYFGDRLAEAGRDVTFLVRERRARQLAMGGLQIVSPHGHFAFIPNMVQKEQGKSTNGYGAILLAVKGYALDGAIEDLAPLMDEDSVIIPLLNGMQHLDMLRKRLGTPTVFGRVAHLMSTLDENARIRHLSKIHEIRYGPLDGVPSCALDRVDDALRGSGFDAVKSLTIMQEVRRRLAQVGRLGGPSGPSPRSCTAGAGCPRRALQTLLSLDTARADTSAANFRPRIEVER